MPVRKNKEPLANIHLSNYTHEFTSTESSESGAIIYIENSMRYKVRHNLCINQRKLSPHLLKY